MEHQHPHTELTAKPNAVFDTVLQFGGDMALAVAIAGFGTVIDGLPNDGQSPAWITVQTVSNGGAGIWAGIAIERFYRTWNDATGGKSKVITVTISAIALILGLSAVFSVMDYNRFQKVGVACERAQAINNTQRVTSKQCVDFFKQRKMADDRLFENP